MKNRTFKSNSHNNWDYYTGDTWKHWIGPKIPSESTNAEMIMAEVERVFQSANKIQECCDRHRRALVGKSPKWFFSNPDSQANAGEADTQLHALIQHWQRLGIGKDDQLADPISEAVLRMLVDGRGYLRLWSPVRFANSPDPIQRVALHSPIPSSVAILKDDDGFIQEIRYTYMAGSDRKFVGSQIVEVSPGEQRIEVQRIDPETNLTIFRYENASGQPIADENGEIEFALDLGGRYSIYEMRRSPLIADSVKRAQNAINFVLTMALRNVGFSGFIREIITNAQPPGEWVEDLTAPNGQKFQPNDEGFHAGPGVTNFIMGAPIYNQNGQVTGYTTPQVSSRQPVDVATFLSTYRGFVALIYEAMGQAHLLASESQLSGVARIQLRQDFITALSEDAHTVAAVVGGIYGSALLMLNQENPEPYKNLNISVQLDLSVSTPMPEETKETRENFKTALLSRATAIANIGIDDPDAEIALIEAEIKQQSAVRSVPVDDLPNPLTRSAREEKP